MDTWNYDKNIHPPTCAPSPSNNQANKQTRDPTSAPQQNANNRNLDDRVIGEAPLAKKICDRPSLAMIIKSISDKGHYIQQNTAGEDH